MTPTKPGQLAARDRLILSGSRPAAPQYFLPGTVYDAALNRMRWIFEQFDGKVSVSCSGGKDSTVVVELALKVSLERNRGPLLVQFLDQEGEYQATVDYMRRLRERPGVNLEWYQIPFRLFNAASHADEWSYVWDEDRTPDEWMRHKEPDSITVNDFVDGRGKQLDRFKPILAAMNERTQGAILTGMRCEESPTRRVFMTSAPSYKWVTWGNSGNTPKGGICPNYYMFHPIYDWTYRDVWKSIHDNDWDYNVFYDAMHRYGVPVRAMRVSSFHHEESMGSLDYLQEIEPETWEKAIQRYKGVNAFGHIGKQQSKDKRVLPFMFSGWQEYFDFLLDKLIPDADNKRKFQGHLDRARKVLGEFMSDDEITRAVTGAIIGNDVYGSTIEKWIVAQTHPTVSAQRGRTNKERAGRAFS